MSTPWGVDLIVSRTQEYLLSRDDYSANIVLSHLQELSRYNNVRVFNLRRNDVPRLILSLYELVSSLDYDSSVLWAAVEALERICQMVPNCSELIEVYKFIPPLASLLHSDLLREKRIRLLCLLKTLTKDSQSSHKQVPLNCLTSKLIEWVITEEVEIVHLSLEILVNLCQKNQLLVYSLKSNIGSRFLQALMNLRTDSLDTKVLMCKLLFILEPIALSVDGPIDVARTIMDVTFSNLMEAFEKNRLVVLRNVVGFFEELVQIPIYKEILGSYDRWEERVDEVLAMLEVVEGAGGRAAVLRLASALVQTDLPPVQRTHPAVAVAALRAAFAPPQQQSSGLTRRRRRRHSPPPPPHEGGEAAAAKRTRPEEEEEGERERQGEGLGDSTCVPSALRLLTFILLHNTTPDHHLDKASDDVVDIVLQHLPDLVSLLHEMDPLKSTDSFICLLDLFEKMLLFEALVPRLLKAVESEHVVSAFHAAASALDASALDASALDASALDASEGGGGGGAARRRQMALLCARAMALLAGAAHPSTARRRGAGEEDSEGWRRAAAALWLHPQGQRALALGFYEGDVEAKSVVLRVASHEGLPPDRALTFAKSLAAYQQSEIEPLQTKEENLSLDLKTATVLGRASGGLIDSFLEEFKQKLETEEGVPVSMAMSLYEYKLAAQSRLQQSLGANVTLAQSSCFGLQHQIDVLDSVIKRQRETLLDRQRLNEGLFLQVGMLKDSFHQEKELRKLRARKHEEDMLRKEDMLAQRKQEHLQSQNNLKSSNEMKRRLEASLSETEKHLKAKCEEAGQLSAHIGDLEQELKTSDKQCKGKTVKLSSLKEQLKEEEQMLAARDSEVKSLKKVQGSLETEIMDLNKVKEAQMKNTSERDKVLQKLRQELSDLKRMRDMITSIAAGGKVE